MKNSLKLTAIATVCLTLIACGGGSNSSGSNTPSTNVAASYVSSGTVTGLGSIIVDGIRIDDSSVSSKEIAENGETETVEVKLGQTVEVGHDDKNKADQVKVKLALHGNIESVTLTDVTIMNTGIKINTDVNLGPVTLFEGFVNLSDLTVGDGIKVYGTPVINTDGSVSLQATRLEKKSVVSHLRYAGRVRDLDTVSKTFKLGNVTVNYSGVANVNLMNGQKAMVTADKTTGYTNGVLTASKVKTKVEIEKKHENISGMISQLDATAKTFYLEDMKVSYTDNIEVKPSKAQFSDIQDGIFVKVKGDISIDSNGIKTVLAKEIGIRKQEDHSSEFELHGSILNFVSNADFMVRDVRVDATNATIDYTDCGSSALSDGLQVEVEGSVVNKLSTDPTIPSTASLVATKVSCESLDSTQNGTTIGADGSTTLPSPPVVIEKIAYVTAVDTSTTPASITISITKDFTPTIKIASVTLLLDGLTLDNLMDKRIKIEYIKVGETFVAKKIRVAKLGL